MSATKELRYVSFNSVMCKVDFKSLMWKANLKSVISTDNVYKRTCQLFLVAF